MFIVCTVATFAAFALLYGFVYRMTARSTTELQLLAVDGRSQALAGGKHLKEITEGVLSVICGVEEFCANLINTWERNAWA